MSGTLSPQEFVDKWRRVELKERSAAQSHFIDLCRLVGHPTPVEDDPTGQRFTFEAGVTKVGGGEGWADVWKKGFFAWEYKGKHKDLDEAYWQLLRYHDNLDQPPLLVVCDMEQIIVHTKFVNTPKRVVRIGLGDLLTPEGMAHLRAIFYEPERFRAPQTTEQVTRAAATEFARLADLLRAYGEAPQEAAHFLIQLLFCLFSEDIGLLPDKVLTRLVKRAGRRSTAFQTQLRQLFQAMATGDFFGTSEIRRFDGRLFDSDRVLRLDSDGLEILARVTDLDWSSIEPSILGTLFWRSLDPAKRAQLGAQYTAKADILLILEPVLMAPLRRRWAEVRAQALELARRRDEAPTPQARKKRHAELESLLREFCQELAHVRVLDAACGSGNFLYVALKLLLDLWKEVSALAFELGLPRLMPLPGLAPSPEQLYGIEINEYAHELAQATIWIGYIQWLHDNGFGLPSEPILKPLDTIRHMDAILSYDDQGRPMEPEWPEADAIVGNPPFLGDKKMRKELGDKYVDDLRSLYSGRLPGQSDLVCYWFEKARAMIERDTLKRAGLLATQGIRGGASRVVLERIKQSGDIFWAQSDRDWILEGASVHVSMVAFDSGQEQVRVSDGRVVPCINADLTSATDLTRAQPLLENVGLAFIGDMKKGSFDIPPETAARLFSAPLNPNRRPNTDVVRPWINGLDITGRPRGMWIVDFGIDMPESEACLYEMPFEYVRTHVKPARDSVRNPLERSRWWLHGRPAPDLRAAVKGLNRYIATARVAKHRLFVFISAMTVPDGQIVVIARSDDYFLGVLHSKVHELWARGTGTQLREAESGFRYTPTTTFETFPFPWPPGREPQDDPCVQAITQAAHELVEKRDRWLNPEGAGEADLKKRTLTNLYNDRPTWLALAHRTLDEAVLDAYGWPHYLGDEEILARLLALNHERGQRI